MHQWILVLALFATAPAYAQVKDMAVGNTLEMANDVLVQLTSRGRLLFIRHDDHPFQDVQLLDDDGQLFTDALFHQLLKIDAKTLVVNSFRCIFWFNHTGVQLNRVCLADPKEYFSLNVPVRTARGELALTTFANYDWPVRRARILFFDLAGPLLRAYELGTQDLFMDLVVLPNRNLLATCFGTGELRWLSEKGEFLHSAFYGRHVRTPVLLPGGQIVIATREADMTGSPDQDALYYFDLHGRVVRRVPGLFGNSTDGSFATVTAQNLLFMESGYGREGTFLNEDGSVRHRFNLNYRVFWQPLALPDGSVVVAGDTGDLDAPLQGYAEILRPDGTRRPLPLASPAGHYLSRGAQWVGGDHFLLLETDVFSFTRPSSARAVIYDSQGKILHASTDLGNQPYVSTVLDSGRIALGLWWKGLSVLRLDLSHEFSVPIR